MLCQPSVKSGWKINTPVQNIHPCAVEWGAADDGGGGDGVLIATDRCNQGGHYSPHLPDDDDRVCG